MGRRALGAGVRHVRLAPDGAPRRDLRRRILRGVDRHRAPHRHLPQLEDRRPQAQALLAGVRGLHNDTGLHLQPVPGQDRHLQDPRRAHHPRVLHVLHGLRVRVVREALHHDVRRSGAHRGPRRNVRLHPLPLDRRCRGRKLYAHGRIHGGVLDRLHPGRADVHRHRDRAGDRRLQRGRLRLDRRRAQRDQPLPPVALHERLHGEGRGLHRARSADSPLRTSEAIPRSAS